MLLSALAEATNGDRQETAKAIKRIRARAGDLLESLGFVCDPY